MFTATYNRAGTLPRVRESLAAQTFRDFEWLVVDDGSTDETPELVRSWVDEGDLDIRYLRKPNGGKHSAWNVGVRSARGELFVSLDSDDACVPEALATFHRVWHDIDPARRDEYSGVCALVMDEDHRLVGDPFPEDVFDSSADALRFEHHVRGEKWGCMRTDVAREFPFPDVDGLRYVPESIVWGRIARRYRERHVNHVLRVWHDDGSARLTAPSWQDPAAFVMSTRVTLEEQASRWLRHDPVHFLKAAANYARNSWLIGCTMGEQLRTLHGLLPRALWLLMLPAARLLLARDRAQQRRAGRRPRP